MSEGKGILRGDGTEKTVPVCFSNILRAQNSKDSVAVIQNQ